MLKHVPIGRVRVQYVLSVVCVGVWVGACTYMLAYTCAVMCFGKNTQLSRILRSLTTWRAVQCIQRLTRFGDHRIRPISVFVACGRDDTAQISHVDIQRDVICMQSHVQECHACMPCVEWYANHTVAQ